LQGQWLCFWPLSLIACSSGNGSETPALPALMTRKLPSFALRHPPTPHAEILAQVKDVLAEQGIDLEVTEYGDYVVPNTAVEEGDEDANYFQHQPYLDQFNEENGTHLVSVAAIHYEPFGIYPGKTSSLDELPDGAVVRSSK
jgi:D-methionine transport system substrate-binding protein